ncbi:TPA: DUF1566 domain-containing protein [Photobacterium damselae]
MNQVNFKLSIISSVVAITLVGCGGGSDSTDDTHNKSSKLNYVLKGQIQPASQLEDHFRVCADIDQDMTCTPTKDIVQNEISPQFTISHLDSKLLKSPIVVFATTKSIDTSGHYLKADKNRLRLFSPAANNYSESSMITVSPISTLLYAMMNNLEDPMSFKQAQALLLTDLQRYISHDITQLDHIELADNLAQQHFQNFITHLVQHLVSLESLPNYEQLVSNLARYHSEIISVFSNNNAVGMELLKKKLLQLPDYKISMNDTGVVRYLVDGKLQDNPSAEFPGQDAEYGLDKSGIKGFNFVKLDKNGQELADNATDWRCVEDKNTGLIWEVKVDDPSSPRDKNRLFAVNAAGYTPNKYDLELATCQQDGSALCDTKQYAEYLNHIKLCGKSNWQLPTVSEQLGILDLGASNEDPDLGLISGMNLKYFPHTIEGDWGAGWYWNKSRAATYYPNTHFIGVDQLGDLIGQTDLGSLSLCDVKEINGLACTDGQVLPVRMIAK